MELKELKSLVALSRLGSITLVAEQLHLSPAAIHKQLKMLEEGLGVRLYEKNGRRLLLTEASSVLLPYVNEMLAQYDSALSALDEWRGNRRGLVRIGAGPTISSYILPLILKKFRTAHPAVELFVQTGNTPVLLENLGKGEIDLALLVSCDLTEAQRFSVEAHWSFEMVLVSHLRQAPRRSELTEFRNARFILFPTGSRMQQPIDRYFAANGFEPNVIMRFDNAEAIKAMIRSGLGMSMLPLWIVDRDLKSQRLTLLRQHEPPLFSKLALVSRRSSYVSQPVRAFIEQSRRIKWGNPRLTTVSARHGQALD